MILDIILNLGFLKDLKSIWLNPNLSFKTIQTRNLDFNRFNPNPQTQILLSKCATKARFSIFFFFFFLRNHALVFSTSRIPWIIAFEVWTPRVKILSRTLLITSRWSFPRLRLLGSYVPTLKCQFFEQRVKTIQDDKSHRLTRVMA